MIYRSINQPTQQRNVNSGYIRTDTSKLDWLSGMFEHLSRRLKCTKEFVGPTNYHTKGGWESFNSSSYSNNSEKNMTAP